MYFRDWNVQLLILCYMCDLFLKRSLINVLQFLLPFCQFVNTAFIHESYCPLMSTTQGWVKYDSDSDPIYIVLHMTWWIILIYNFDKIPISYNNCVSPSVFFYSGVSFTYSFKSSCWRNRVTLINCGLLPLCNVFKLQKKTGLSLQACCWNIILSHNYKQCSMTQTWRQGLTLPPELGVVFTTLIWMH